MLERGDDCVYICYDNELYANTGVQKSGATPFGAATTTSQVGIVHQGKEKDRKPIVEIAAAHNIPYAASASIAFLADFKMKLKKAAAMRGPRFITVHAPCCLGAGFDGGLSMKVARLAVQTRQWFLFEIEKGKFKLNFDAKTAKPVGEYLELQKRFAHVTPEMEAVIQKKADKNYERFVEWNKRENTALQANAVTPSASTNTPTA
jgi:pyruvate ferredoxin oxidoreductase beta subunit